MFTINAYAFHPLIQRFVRLWKNVKVVSDIVVFVLSMICCQCMNTVPLASNSSTVPSVQIMQINQENTPTNTIVDAGRESGEPLRAQHLVIDFTPGREDTPEIQARCHEFWQFAKNQPKLNGMMVQPPPKSERRQADLSSSAINQNPSSKTDNSLPAIHMFRKMDKKGALKAALATTEANKYFS